MSEKKNFGKGGGRSKYIAYLYLAIAVCVVAVMTVSIYSLSFGTDVPDDLSISIPDIPTPSIPDINDNEPTGDESDSEVGGTESGVDDEVIDTVSFVIPLEGTVSKKYAMDALVYSATMKDYRTHSGVDIVGEEGAEVLAYTAGTVKEIYDDVLMGRTVVIEHEYGLVSYYMNLAETMPEGIEAGAQVKAGDVIGYVGTSAKLECAEGPHLHFELTVNGSLRDSYKELKLVNG